MKRNIIADLEQQRSLEASKTKLIEHLKGYAPDDAMGISFDVRDDGQISLTILGHVLSASPRLVNMWEHDLVLEWKFVAKHGAGVVPIWGFYLFQDGNIYDESTGAFSGAPEVRLGDYQNQYLGKKIVTSSYEHLLESDVFKP